MVKMRDFRELNQQLN